MSICDDDRRYASTSAVRQLKHLIATASRLEEDDDISMLPGLLGGQGSSGFYFPYNPALELVAEWLLVAADHGLILPEYALVDVLTGLEEIAPRTFVAPVVGPAGRRLVLDSPGHDWDFALLPGTPECADRRLWDHGTDAQRGAYLQTIRGEDAAAGRDMARSAWPGASPLLRFTIANALEVGLGPEDEPLLEELLDSEGHDPHIRDLLARLPGSAYTRRMAGRVRTLSCVRNFTHEHRLVLQIPDHPDAALVRDVGYDCARGRSGGIPAWVWSVLHHAPLGTWTAHLAMAPGELLDLPLDGIPSDVLHHGWATAATIQQDRSWALAFCRAGQLERVVHALEPDDAQREAARLLRSARFHPQYGFNHVSMRLTSLPPYWRDELAAALLDLLIGHIGGGGAPYEPGMLWDFAAFRLDPRCFDRVDTALGELDRSLPGYPRLSHLAEGLRYRLELRVGLRAGERKRQTQ